VCYYRIAGPDGPKSRQKAEYFGHVAGGEARDRDCELEQSFRRPAPAYQGPLFFDLAYSHLQDKQFNADSRKHLRVRLTADILPVFGNMPALRLGMRTWKNTWLPAGCASNIRPLLGKSQTSRRF
jgi:hypothetical protein